MIRRVLINNTMLLAILGSLFATLSQAAEYNRDDWGGWRPTTRAEVMQAHAVNWVQCYYTGAVVPPGAIQIDHVVPVKYAWTMGAYSLPVETKREFYNDRDNLLPVLAGPNASKGDKGWREWMLYVHKDEYMRRWRVVCGRYGLNCFAGE